jgi:acyl carrier protein
MTPIIDEIISLLADITHRPPAAFSPDAAFDIDSLDRVELEMAVEDRWHLVVPGYLPWEWRTPAEVARWVSSQPTPLPLPGLPAQ